MILYLVPKSSFIHAAYQDHKVGEPKSHLQAKARIRSLLEAQGYEVKSEYPFPLKVELGDRDYSLDLYASTGLDRIDVEIMGDSHFTTKRKLDKDHYRRKAIEAQGLRFVQFNVDDVNGCWRKHRLTGSKYWFQLTDAEIREEFGYD